MIAKRLRTPSDFRRTVGSLSFGRHDWIEVRTEFEPVVRNLLAEIFDDLPFISMDEPGLVSAYLDGIAEPLAGLQTLGLQLVGITATGTMAMGDGSRIPWSQTDYIVAPMPCFFQVDGELAHLLGADCETGTRAATRQGSRLAWWASAEALEQSFEGAVPWCPTCAAESIELRTMA